MTEVRVRSQVEGVGRGLLPSLVGSHRPIVRSGWLLWDVLSICKPVVLHVAVRLIPNIVLCIASSVIHVPILLLLLRVDIVILLSMWHLVGSVSIPTNYLGLIERVATWLIITVVEVILMINRSMLDLSSTERTKWTEIINLMRLAIAGGKIIERLVPKPIL